MARHHVGNGHTYDAIDDKILAMITKYPPGDPRRPSFTEIREKIPRANHSRCVRAVWRSKREAKENKMKQPKLQAVETRTEPNASGSLSDLRAMVQKFVQEVSASPDTIQDMSVTITTPKGTVAVRWSQEVKPAEG